MKIVLGMLAVSLIAVAPNARAQPAHGVGIGIESCGTWTSEAQTKNINWLGHIAWLGGFITSYNVFGSKTGDLLVDTDMPGAQGWVDNYCKDHPLDVVGKAAYQLVIELEARHLLSQEMEQPRDNVPTK
jgi:hypothetical protein